VHGIDAPERLGEESGLGLLDTHGNDEVRRVLLDSVDAA
jgi:hypothetical protein